MVVIRLTRAGARNRPFYRIVAVDQRRPRDGRPLEFLGTFDPKVSPEKLSVRSDAVAACEAVQRLADAIGIPKRLRDVGVTEEILEPLARQAIADGCHATNPRVFKYEDFLEGYRAAY